MKKLLFLTIASLLSLTAALDAQYAYFVKKGGNDKPMECEELGISKRDAKQLAYVRKGSKGELQIPINQVKYAWIPKPEAVSAADTALEKGEYDQAATQYQAAAAEFKLFGWDPYCRFQAAIALSKAQKYDQAIAILNAMRKETFVNPDDTKYNKEASLRLGQVYLDAKKYSAALLFAQEQCRDKDDDLACAAHLLSARIYRMQADEEQDANKKKAILEHAAYAYFGAALLFKKSASRPEALYNSWQIMRELKDARAEEFAKILRADYPDNEYTKKLQ